VSVRGFCESRELVSESDGLKGGDIL